MPIDSRRLATPDVSLDPMTYSTKITVPVLNNDGVRSDGRDLEDLRPIHVNCGLVSKATGSAYCEIGVTKVICAVHGPKDIEQKEDFQMNGKIRCEFKFAPFSCKKRRDHIPSAEENELSSVLTDALKSLVCLKKYPKSQIEVHVLVLDNGGSALSAAFMAASLALADASIDMFDILTSCSVRVLGEDVFVVDPDQEEEQLVATNNSRNNGLVTVAVLPTLNQVASIMSTGTLSCEVLSKAMEKCVEAAQSRYPALRECYIDMIKTAETS